MPWSMTVTAEGRGGYRRVWDSLGFPALLGWICAGEAVVNVVRDRWPGFRFAFGSNEWTHGDALQRPHF